MTLGHPYEDAAKVAGHESWRSFKGFSLDPHSKQPTLLLRLTLYQDESCQCGQLRHLRLCNVQGCLGTGALASIRIKQQQPNHGEHYCVELSSN